MKTTEYIFACLLFCCCLIFVHSIDESRNLQNESRNLQNVSSLLLFGQSIARRGVYPWYVELEAIRSSSSKRRRCGGVMLGGNTLLTLANCVYDRDGKLANPKNSQAWIVRSTVRSEEGFQKSWKSIRTHPQHVFPNEAYNVAVILLDGNTLFPQRAVGSLNSENNQPPVGTNVSLVGFGAGDGDDASSSVDFDQTLRETTAIVRGQGINTCQVPNVTQFLCADTTSITNVDLCGGEEGGPMVRANTLYGLFTRNGASCETQSGRSAIFVRVSAYRNFILEASCNLGGDAECLASFTANPPSLGDFTCFSERTTVQHRDKGEIPMSELQVGDHIRTSHGYEPVYAFGHHLKDTPATFLQIYTTNRWVPLEITHSHMVFVQNQSNPVRADSLRVGDIIQDDNQHGRVTKIRSVHRNGLFAPLTPSGSLLVNNGMHASCYISLQANATKYIELQGGYSTRISQQHMIHMALSPFRMLCMGLSTDFCYVDNAQGMPGIVSLCFRFAAWADSLHFGAQIMVCVLFLAVIGSVWILELCFGAAWAPTIMVFVVLLIWGTRGRLVHIGGRQSNTVNNV